MLSMEILSLPGLPGFTSSHFLLGSPILEAKIRAFEWEDDLPGAIFSLCALTRCATSQTHPLSVERSSSVVWREEMDLI